MDIKERYKEAKFLENKVDRLKEELESLGVDISAIDTTKDAVQTSNKSDLSDKVLKINDLKANIEECLQQIVDYKKYVKKLLDKITDENEYNIMFYKYIMFMRSEEIAVKMHYSKRRVDQIHGHVLKKLRKIS